MSDQMLLEENKMRAGNPSGVAVKTEDGSDACPEQRKGWLKGPLGMAICCGAPLLLVAAISFFDLSLGTLATGFLNLAAVIACPVAMYMMMRMMMKRQK